MPSSIPKTGEVALLGRRLRIIQATVVVLFFALVAGLGYWQVNRSEEFVAAARRQTLRRVIVPAPRGTIQDREHRVLAEDRTRVAAVINLGTLREEIQQERESLRAAGNK